MEYCLFLSTVETDPISAIIRRATNCDWSHAGFMRLADGWTFSAMSDGQGVAWRPPNPNAKILKLSVQGIESALSEALSQAGSKYDFMDIAGIALGCNWSAPGSFICDKLVFWAFQEIGAPLVNPKFIPAIHLTPRDILLSPYVTEIP